MIPATARGNVSLTTISGGLLNVQTQCMHRRCVFQVVGAQTRSGWPTFSTITNVATAKYSNLTHARKRDSQPTWKPCSMYKDKSRAAKCACAVHTTPFQKWRLEKWPCGLRVLMFHSYSRHYRRPICWRYHHFYCSRLAACVYTYTYVRGSIV